MRKIKFRAWDKKKNKWLHSYDKLGGCSIFGETIILGMWLSEIRIENLNEVEVMQFTGLLDKQGVEIYEGDIILWENSDSEKVKSKVVFYNGAFRMRNMDFLLHDYMDSNVFEVIGNIYENPELLENK